MPAQIQRMIAEDLLAGIFPDAKACLENLQGAREVPCHPLVEQAMRDCLEEAMDLPQLITVLQRIFDGEVRCLGKDTPEPSVFSHELVNSAVYTFLDDAPLEERRTRAVHTRRASEPRSADDLGALDPAAIERVREEAWPSAQTADELHDALLLTGFIRDSELTAEESHWSQLFDTLIANGRAFDAGGYWVSVERFDEFNAVMPQIHVPPIPERLRREWTREDALRELTRSRLDVLGPVTARELTDDLNLKDTGEIDAALLALETEGRVLRGYFSPASIQSPLEWCDRRLLARIHRYTLNRLRAEIEPVLAADFMRFLLHWQHVDPEDQVAGVDGLAAVIAQLDGYEVAADAWEKHVLPARVREYDASLIDTLCLSGRVAWGRLTPMETAGKAPLKSSPIALMLREHAALWRVAAEADTSLLTSEARAGLDALRSRGALFFHEIVTATRLLPTLVERALGELAGAGLVTADSFSGLRALLTPPEKRKSLSGRGAGRASMYGVDTAGRWALLTRESVGGDSVEAPDRVEPIARALLARYGVVFRALLARESRLPPWRELVMVYRRLEARGEIRGGRFVSGFGGEQFAAPDAVGRLRAVRKQEKSGALVSLSGADPLNLVGILTPEARVAAFARNRILLRDGVPIAALEGGEVRRLAETELSDESLRAVMTRRLMTANPRPWLRTESPRERLLRGRAATTREGAPKLH
jgi:ATP-dependent Lhr-like helicase